MVNKEQLSVLKQGVEAWNGWRSKNLYVYADLNEADLNEANLGDIDLRIAHLRRASLFRADLSRSNLSGADLSDANLREANLNEANLTNANLNGANLGSAFVKGSNLTQANLLAVNLRNANLSQVNLSEANLTVAHLAGADLSGANLCRSNLTKSQLSGTNLRRADLSGATLNQARLTKAELVDARFIQVELVGTNVSESKAGNTIFANSDLSGMTGLEHVVHLGPSHISMDTLVLSRGKIPEAFLRGCGLSDADIEYAKLTNPALHGEEIDKILHRIEQLRRVQAIQVSPLFISYSEGDKRFVEKISGCLSDKGIRYWHHLHKIKPGREEKPVDRAVGRHPKVLLVLSEHARESGWIEQEVRSMRGLEKEIGRQVLFPVALDGHGTAGPWSKRLGELIQEEKMLDFSSWKDGGRFDEMFHHLIAELDLSHPA